MKNKKLLCLGLCVFSLGAVATMALSSVKTGAILSSVADAKSYTLTLDSTNAPSLSSSYQASASAKVGPTVVNYVYAKAASSGHVTVAPSGKIFNYSTDQYNGRLTGISSVKVNFTSTGKLYLQTSVRADGLEYGDKVELTSGTAVTFSEATGMPNFFMVTNGNNETVVTSMEVTYACQEVANYSLNNLAKQYTAKVNDTIYSVTRDGANVTLKSLNLESNVSLNGTVAVTSAGAVTFTIPYNASATVTYKGQVSTDGSAIVSLVKSDNVGGVAASAFPNITQLNKVYNVEDFESYSATGVGYDANHNMYSTTELRANYYQDYSGGTTNSIVNTSGYQLMGSSDYLNLATNLDGNTGKSATLKGSTAGWMRYWQMKSVQGLHYAIGKGNTFSFYAHGAYTGTSYATASAKNVKLTVRAYYSPAAIREANRDSNCAKQVVTVNANTGWKQYTVSLDPTKTVYGFGISVENPGAAAYVPIDNVEIFTENPHATYTPEMNIFNESATKFTQVFTGPVTTVAGTLSMKLSFGANGKAWGYCGTNLGLSTYSVTGDTFTATSTASYSGMTFGTITGTLSADRKSISNVTCSGTIASAISAPVALTADTMLCDCDADTATLQGMWSRYYYSGSWTLDTGNADRVKAVTDHYIQGTGSMYVRPYATEKVKLGITSSVAAAQESLITSIKALNYWIYIPYGGLKVQTYYWDDTNLVGSKYHMLQETTYTDAQVGWNFVSVGVTGTAYDFSLTIFNASQAVYIDAVSFSL